MIQFSELKFRNILSTGNPWTVIALDEFHNTLVMGENGSGKSTILDALTFVLFNKPFRKINRPQLVNSISEGDLMVEIKFTIGTRNYKVRRGIKPGVFDIYVEGKLVPAPSSAKDHQAFLETQILKFNYKAFTQVVILGSSTFVPFMQLVPAQRREIIEDLLDINIFSAMNGILKERITEHKEINQANQGSIALKDQFVKLQAGTLNRIKSSNDTEIGKIKETLKQNKIEWQHYLDSGMDCAFAITYAQKKPWVLNLPQNIAKLRDAEKILGTLARKITGITKHISFFEDNQDCPTCEQELEVGFKQTSIREHREKQTECLQAQTDLEARIKTMEATVTKGTESMAYIEETKVKMAGWETKQLAANTIITTLETQISNIHAKEDTTKIQQEIEEAEVEMAALEVTKQELAEMSELYKQAASLLKDSGIKTLIVKQYLPVMNRLINQYLAKMDFFVNFELDENFTETIKSRHRDEFSYASFSEGEKTRINLALLFTWRAVARMKNSINTNLLIMDEIFDSSLDDAGTQEFLKILYALGMDQNIFVISHKSDQLQDKFKNTILFEKIKGYSKIV